MNISAVTIFLARVVHYLSFLKKKKKKEKKFL